MNSDGQELSLHSNERELFSCFFSLWPPNLHGDRKSQARTHLLPSRRQYLVTFFSSSAKLACHSKRASISILTATYLVTFFTSSAKTACHTKRASTSLLAASYLVTFFTSSAKLACHPKRASTSLFRPLPSPESIKPPLTSSLLLNTTTPRDLSGKLVYPVFLHAYTDLQVGSRVTIDALYR